MKDKINSILSEAKGKISDAVSEGELQNVKSAYTTARRPRRSCLPVWRSSPAATVSRATSSSCSITPASRRRPPSPSANEGRCVARARGVRADGARPHHRGDRLAPAYEHRRRCGAVSRWYRHCARRRGAEHRHRGIVSARNCIR